MGFLPRQPSDISAHFESSRLDPLNKISGSLRDLLLQNPKTLNPDDKIKCDRLAFEYLQNSTAPDTSSNMIIKRLLTVAHNYSKENNINSRLQEKLYYFTMRGIYSIEKERINLAKKYSENGGDGRKYEKEHISGEVFLHVRMRYLAIGLFKKTRNTIWLEHALHHSEQTVEKIKYITPQNTARDYSYSIDIADRLYKITKDQIWKQKLTALQQEQIHACVNSNAQNIL